MQPNTITLAVDELNNGTTIDRLYTRFEELTDRSTYVGPLHTVSMRDMFSLYRRFPKQSGNFRGVIRPSIKFTQDYDVLGVDGMSVLTSPYILEVSESIPVGVATADVLIMRQRAMALLDSDAIMNPFHEALMI